MSPEDPMPATARPIMSMVDDWATPQIRDPSSKMAKQTRYVHYIRTSVLMNHVSQGKGS